MVQADRVKAIAIVGCTAVGKSAVAIKLAKRFNGVVIGADSMQIYRGFDIGTGKLSRSQMDGVDHRLIDIVDGDADFSVGEYVERAALEIADCAAKNKLPIITGGTGLYVNSLFSGCNFAGVPKNENVRSGLKLSAHVFGPHALHSLLGGVDGDSAAKINNNDCKRIVRALEIYSVTGEPKSTVTQTERPYNDLTIVLTLPRELLYERINARVKQMFDDGLVEEVLGLLRYKDHLSMQAIGYKQIAQFPDLPRSELEPLVAQKTRNYAKRQTTYFNNMKLNKIFIDARDHSAVEHAVASFLGE